MALNTRATSVSTIGIDAIDSGVLFFNWMIAGHGLCCFDMFSTESGIWSPTDRATIKYIICI